MIFYNVETKEYPRYQGDLELLGWKVGEELPTNWVKVLDERPLVNEPFEYLEEATLPEYRDGKYFRKYQVICLTQEQIQARFQVEEEDTPFV
jgi:hypothetical protein